MGNKRNQKVRLELEQLYGKGDMFDKAGIEQKVEQLRTIKTYRQYLEEKHYKRKFISHYDKLMTVHHLKHKADGGETNIKNCVLTSSLKQMYIHSLPRKDEEVINNMLREYIGQPQMTLEEKKKKYKKAKVQLVDELDTGVEIKFTDVEFYQPTLEEYIKEQEEREQFAKYLEERRKRQLAKFKKPNDALDLSLDRGKAFIDAEWEEEIRQDVLDEFNERNFGGYGGNLERH